MRVDDNEKTGANLAFDPREDARNLTLRNYTTGVEFSVQIPASLASEGDKIVAISATEAYRLLATEFWEMSTNGPTRRIATDAATESDATGR